MAKEWWVDPSALPQAYKLGVTHRKSVSSHVLTHKPSYKGKLGMLD